MIEVYMAINLSRPNDANTRQLTNSGSDHDLSPRRRQTIIWANAEMLLIWPLWTSFAEISLEVYTLSFHKMHLKMPFGKWRPFCLDLNVVSISVASLLIQRYYSCWPHQVQCEC